MRFELLRVNYRLPLNFTLAGMEGARTSLARLDEWVERIAAAGRRRDARADAAFRARGALLTALDDDLNISGALGHLFDLVRASNHALDEGSLTAGQSAQLLADWQRLNQVLALERDAAAVPAEVEALWPSGSRRARRRTGAGATSCATPLPRSAGL